MPHFMKRMESNDTEKSSRQKYLEMRPLKGLDKLLGSARQCVMIGEGFVGYSSAILLIMVQFTCTSFEKKTSLNMTAKRTQCTPSML